MSRASLTRVELPDFGRPATMPVIPDAVYRARLERLRQRMTERGLDRLVVYADREHSANISYLTGFDPRFEEAILVVGPDDDPAVLVGNECWGMAGATPVAMRRHLLQDLSLPSQPRDRSRPMAEILAGEGIEAGSRVGVVGWKLFADGASIDLPHFIVSALQRLTGAEGAVTNQGEIRTGEGGQVVLVAPRVENSGLVTTPGGDILLAAGRSVEIVDPSRPGVSVQVDAADIKAY